MKKVIGIILIVILFLLIRNTLMAQDSSRVFVTTGAGIIKTPGALSNVFQPSIAFNSGIELVNKKNWFLQGTLDQSGWFPLSFSQHQQFPGNGRIERRKKLSLRW
jgi:hypothetical protein